MCWFELVCLRSVAIVPSCCDDPVAAANGRLHVARRLQWRLGLFATDVNIARKET